MIEHGKTRSDAEAEFDAAVAGIRFTAESARRLDGRIVSAADRNKTVLIRRHPIGVVVAITPWNVPFMVPFEYIAPALAMGNAVVWKPAESVPHTSRHIAAALESVQWPDGAVTMLSGGPATGGRLARSAGIDALCFTGSSDVGEDLAAIGGGRRLILELGGNGPTVVFADADLDAAARRIVRGTCFLSGQSCASTERILVEASVETELLEALVEHTRHEQVGDPRDPYATLGPVHLAETSSTIGRHLKDAVGRGARVLIGGSPLEDAPTQQYWRPTVVSGVSPGMDVFQEETFGPVMPVSSFRHESEVGPLADKGGYGLSSAVFTKDIERAFKVAERLPASFVVINNTSNYWEMHLPWGGAPGSKSGVGRLGGDHALQELSTTSTIVLDLSSTDT